MTDQYYMPAEWAEHDRTVLEWPVQASMVHPENYEAVCRNYAAIADAISEFETVTMIVNDNSEPYARQLCSKKTDMVTIPHNDAWCRDNGPTIVFDSGKKRYGINWQFNAWGGKYPNYDLDNRVASTILSYLLLPVIDSSFVLEGGSIHVDGEGTLLTTKECLLHPSRNPEKTAADIEAELKDRLGISKIIWLNKGLAGDETDGHIDNAACFIRPGTVMIQMCYDEADQNYAITHENLQILQNTTDAKGRKLTILEVEQPPARFYEGERLTLSYMNFYIANHAIIVPVFGGAASDADKAAAKLLASAFPERKVILIDTSWLITEGGNIHCITQQIPKET